MEGEGIDATQVLSDSEDPEGHGSPRPSSQAQMNAQVKVHTREVDELKEALEKQKTEFEQKIEKMKAAQMKLGEMKKKLDSELKELKSHDKQQEADTRDEIEKLKGEIEQERLAKTSAQNQ